MHSFRDSATPHAARTARKTSKQTTKPPGKKIASTQVMHLDQKRIFYRRLVETASITKLTDTRSRSSGRLNRWSLESLAACPALLATHRESPTFATSRQRERPSKRTTSAVDPLVSPSCIIYGRSSSSGSQWVNVCVFRSCCHGR